jgi:glycosyltransferase involved in cell wall biosynthesis
MASPFVSKLAAISARVHSAHPFDVILSHYLEPYGVAGYLAAQITGRPHVVRLAGSDAGRLWHHPQLEALYDHILRSAQVVLAAGAVAERAIARGVNPARIAFAGGYVLPEHLFTPDGPALDIQRMRLEMMSDPDLRERLWGEFTGCSPYFGVYGKLGENKGSFALLHALHRLKLEGLNIGLVALAHGRPDVDHRFREEVRELCLVERIVQIPFLPHWRVPEFLRGCLAVCCLEHKFPIRHHTPMTPREVLLCGACLVGSAEIIRKLPAYERLPHAYGCVAIDDVNDIEALSRQLAAITRDPGLATVVGKRGRKFARDLQRRIAFPQTLERILHEAAHSRLPLHTRQRSDQDDRAEGKRRYPLTRQAMVQLAKMHGRGRAWEGASGQSIDLAAARKMLAEIKREVANGHTRLQALARAVQIETRIAAAENESDRVNGGTCSDPLFRVRARRWALDNDDLLELIPRRDPILRIVRFDFDVSKFRSLQKVVNLPSAIAPGPSFLVVFGCVDGLRREPLLVDGYTAQTLKLSDGTRTVSEILQQLAHGNGKLTLNDDIKWIEDLFILGLLHLDHR